MKIGIAKCLLGENVRYNGGHKLDRYLRDVLGQFVEYIPVCPEVDCGLSIPREPVRLVDTGKGEIHLMTCNTGIDHTEQMRAWAQKCLNLLETEPLCGYIWKAGSPSSGMRDIKVYDEEGKVIGKNSGIFAGMFLKRFPLIPVEDEGRLNDERLRENFIERIFIYERWLEYQKQMSVSSLLEFHARHKLILMAHSPKIVSELGSLAASAKQDSLPEISSRYIHLLMPALAMLSTVKKNTNVLEHCAGYFKKLISADEKKELAEVISEYHRELIPLIVPVTLLNHYVRKYQVQYLKDQYYLCPHPHELKLRNHV